jgi:iron complex outermembrane recepter protein
MRYNSTSLVFLASTALATALSNSDIAYSQVIELPEIVVTAPSPILLQRQAGQPSLGEFPIGTLIVPKNTFSSVTVIPRTEIAREQPRTLGDALQDRPGISSTGYAPGGASRPIIRGLESTRVRIQENGTGVHDVSSLGEDHAVPVNPLIANQIEVIRGPATLRYGSQAIGGVVSVENNRIPKMIPIHGVSGQVLGGLSSVDRGRNAAASVDAGHGNIAVHADGFKTVSGDYQTPLGRQSNSASQSTGGAVGASYIFDQGFIGASISHFESLYHIPGGEAANKLVRLDPKQDKVQIQGEYRFQSGPFEAIRFWFGGSNYKHNEISVENGLKNIGATFKNREIEGRVELQHTPVSFALGKLTGAAGLQAGRSKIGTAGEAGGLLAPADTRNLAAYVFEQFAFNSGFKLQAAGRIESARLSGTSTLFPDDYLPNGVDLIEEKRRRNYAAKSFSFGALQDLPFGFVESLRGNMWNAHLRRLNYMHEERMMHLALLKLVIQD